MKQILFGFLVLCVGGLTGQLLQTSAAQSSSQSPGGLVAAWNFDETKGEQVKDSSGHGHHGILRGAKRAAGKFGGAVECEKDALIEVPHTPELNDFKQGITIAAWVNRRADESWNTVISREIKDGWSEYFGLAVVKNKALFSVDGDGANYQNIKSDEDMPVGEWIHLAGTYDNVTFKLYVNGRLVKSAPYAIPFKFADTNPLLIGGNTNTQGKQWLDCFHGRIDDLRLFNRGLSEKEIAALFAGASRKP
ncbi:MAG: LamG domain-containing protein [Blastocatellales bacterium]